MLIIASWILASDVDPISLAIAKTALMRAGMGQPPNPPKNNTTKLPSRPNSSKGMTSSQAFYTLGVYIKDLLFVESVTNKTDLDSASTRVVTKGITHGENQSSSETTEKCLSTRLKESGNSYNVSSKSSAAPGIGESNIMQTAFIGWKEMGVGRPQPTSNSTSGGLICLNLYYHWLSKRPINDS